jgi:hypothetical protein
MIGIYNSEKNGFVGDAGGYDYVYLSPCCNFKKVKRKGLEWMSKRSEMKVSSGRSDGKDRFATGLTLVNHCSNILVEFAILRPDSD